MSAQTHLFPCLQDNYGVLVHDPIGNRTLWVAQHGPQGRVVNPRMPAQATSIAACRQELKDLPAQR